MPTTIQFLLKYKGVNPQNGQYSFEDLDNNGVIDANPGSKDLHPVDLTPKFYGGLQNNFTYKNLEFDFLFTFKKQKGFYGVGTDYIPGTALQNQPIAVMERWRNPGDITNVRAFTTTATEDYYQFTSSDANIVDASYIRLQNISLSYKIPQRSFIGTDKIDINLFLRGQNLFTITSYKGTDAANPSRNVNSFPSPSIYTMGVNCSF